MGPQNHNAALVEPQHHVINSTNTGSALNNGVKNRLHVRGRAADDAEHLGCCRLMLQRLSQFCIAFLDLLKQSHVLDSDHCLRSEGIEKSDLLVGEGSNLDSPHQNDTQRNSLTEQRSRKHRSIAESLLEILAHWELALVERPDIADMDRLPVDNGTASHRTTAEGNRLKSAGK